MYNLTDGVARLDGGYPVVVGGAIGYIGQQHKVRIDRATRTTAYATLLDAKPTAIDTPPEPGDYELPEFDREVGERLELEERRGRARAARRPAKTTAAVTDREPRGGGRRAGRRGRGGAPSRGAGRARSRPPRRPPAEARRRAAGDRGRCRGGDRGRRTPTSWTPRPRARRATAKRRRRRGKRGGRGRSKAAATDGDGAAPTAD